MKYKNYTAQDFVSDPYFQKWVKAPDAEVNAFWEDWLNKYPFKKLEIEEAKSIIEVLGFSSDLEANKDFIKVWNNIQAKIAEKQVSAPVSEPQISLFQQLKPYRMLAAVFLGFVIISIGLLLLKPERPQTIRYTTGFGQIKNITLPDRSQVTLNANSVLSFKNDWEGAETRQVNLEGEAFFRVLKKKNTNAAYAKFKVKTKNITVEVLGTEFNVNDRRDYTHVVLQSGKVMVEWPEPSGIKKIFIQPGEYLGYSNSDNQLIRKTVDTKLFTDWVNRKLTFNKTTLKDIAILLENNYGYQVTFKDEALAQNRFTGTIPSNDINLLFTALIKLYDLHIIQNQNQLMLVPNKAGKPKNNSPNL